MSGKKLDRDAFEEVVKRAFNVSYDAIKEEFDTLNHLDAEAVRYGLTMATAAISFTVLESRGMPVGDGGKFTSEAARAMSTAFVEFITQRLSGLTAKASVDPDGNMEIENSERVNSQN